MLNSDDQHIMSVVPIVHHIRKTADFSSAEITPENTINAWIFPKSDDNLIQILEELLPECDPLLLVVSINRFNFFLGLMKIGD
jgi:hypothetical protein